jgi:hypothetical protein
MATHPLFQSYNPPIPFPAKPNIRVVFSVGDAVLAVRGAMAKLPSVVRTATLDEIAIGESAGELIVNAAATLSVPMYRAFLSWGAAAAAFESDRDEELSDGLCAALMDALREVASVPAHSFQDALFKSWLLALEVSDSQSFGPLRFRPQDAGYIINSVAEGLGRDLPMMSPLVASIERFSTAAAALSPPQPRYPFTLEVGAMIAGAFSAAGQHQDIEVYEGTPSGVIVPPSMHEWLEARAMMELIQVSVDGHSGTPEPEINRLCSRLVEAQIELLTTPAPTALELAFKQRLYFEIDAHEFDEASIGASITADVDRLMCSARQPAETGEINARIAHLSADPHTAWLADRNGAQAAINAHDETLTDEAADALTTYTVDRDREIANTPANTRDGVLAKFALVAQISLEGFEPNMDWVALALVDAQRVAGIGSLAGAVEARHREMAA